jgi:hypothetical protein
MAIEGPLQELGLPDVFQLIDLSRKTGMLRVTTRQLDDEGIVFFDGGRVVQAILRSKPATPINVAALTPRELQRKVRTHIEGVVFDLMNWREGFFSFEERDVGDVPGPLRASVATESLLMESARRIDEWSHIIGRIPHLGVVPALADVTDDHETQLDLLPHEWQVLSLIDGERDIRSIAQALDRAEFDTAKVVYGLITTGVVEIRRDDRVDGSALLQPEPEADIEAMLERGMAAVRGGNFATARENLSGFLAAAPDHPDAPRAAAALTALTALLGALDRAPR